MNVHDWFLTESERGNPATDIDRRKGASYTDGNEVRVLVHGREYYKRLYEILQDLRPGDWIHFTDWRGDPDERLDGEGTEIARVLADLARRRVHVRGLVWRSHTDKAHFSEEENLHLVETVNEAGGEVLLDERVRRDGSHHQKLFVARHPDDPDRDVAFVGGIDLCHGRNDDAGHRGDPQSIDIDARYGSQPAWHDIQAEVHGPAVGDIAFTFRERWEDPTPLDHRTPWRRALRTVAREPTHPAPLPGAPRDPAPCGAHAVQVLRTYPAKRPRFPFAPDGERSVARAYQKAFARARRLVYIEDQYLWSRPAARALADQLRVAPDLRLIAVVPRYPEENGRISGPPNRIGQQRAIDLLRDAGGERVMIFDLEAETGLPIYVHAKICIVDDVWMMVGSDNLNLRSWTNDSELACAVLDATLDERAPNDPAGLGDGARLLARDTRLRLWREHLGRADGDDADLVDPLTGADALRESAQALEQWVAGGRVGPRPRGRLRPHCPEPVHGLTQLWADLLHRAVVDPDGRPRALRRRGEF